MLNEPLAEIPAELSEFGLELGEGGTELVYTYDSQRERTGITTLLGELEREGISFHDLNTSQSSLEEIFVDLVKRER
jgi:ABC-2 type transport system ATP-binding protein